MSGAEFEAWNALKSVTPRREAGGFSGASQIEPECKA